MTLTEVMVSTLVWGLTAMGVLQIWAASGTALASAQRREQALEAIDADLLHTRARWHRHRAVGATPIDCTTLAASLALELEAQPLQVMPGLSRRIALEGDELWLAYTYSQGQIHDERRRLLSPEALGLCSAADASLPGGGDPPLVPPPAPVAPATNP